jgi:alpha-L-fucosidase
MSDNDAAANQHKIIGVQKALSGDLQRPPVTDWFYKGGLLGLFIHYGISTVRAEGDISWGMMDRTPWDKNCGGNWTITPREYWEQARSFNPQRFDPDNWMRAIKDAGFSYAVFTTRHHDGFSMWPSDYGYLNTKNYMGGRDLVGEYIEACRKNGIRVGLYYSPPDWFMARYYMSFLWGSDDPVQFPDRRPAGLDLEPLEELPVMPPALQADLNVYVNNQVRELLTRYGKIDLLWFDGSLPDRSKLIPIEEIFSLQPEIIINNRGHGIGYNSEYECRLPDTKPEGFFEHCHIWMENCGWAHMNRCTGYRSAQWVYDSYRTVRDWGGNMLINAGPRADGTLPDIFYQRVQELKALLAKG